jgi:hypothetical protein
MPAEELVAALAERSKRQPLVGSAGRFEIDVRDAGFGQLVGEVLGVGAQKPEIGTPLPAVFISVNWYERAFDQSLMPR